MDKPHGCMDKKRLLQLLEEAKSTKTPRKFYVVKRNNLDTIIPD